MQLGDNLFYIQVFTVIFPAVCLDLTELVKKQKSNMGEKREA